MKPFLQVMKYLGIYFVSFILLSFSISKMMNVQFQVTHYAEYIPLKDLPRFWHAWSFFGRSYPYNLFIALIEFSTAVLLLFPRTRLMGLLMAAGLYINILAVDLAFDVTNAQLHVLLEFLIVVLLLFSYRKDLKTFFWDMQGRLKKPVMESSRFLNTMLPVIFILLVSTGMIILLRQTVRSADRIIGAYKINQIIVGTDTLPLGQGKYTRDPMLFFEFDHSALLSFRDSTFGGLYSTRGDSLIIHLSRGFNGIQSVAGIFSTDGKSLVGITDKQEPFRMKVAAIRK